MEIVAATSFARLSGGERDHMVGFSCLRQVATLCHVVAIDKRHVRFGSRDSNDISVEIFTIV